MPESRNNYIVQGLSGTFAGLGTFHTRGGKTFLRKIQAKSSKPDSEKQKANKERFAICTAYAKGAIKNPDLLSIYRSKAKPGRSAYNMALADAFHAPAIRKFKVENYSGRPGDSFIVEAIHRFKVASVYVTIHNAAGDLVEQGSAEIQVFEFDWKYVATVSNENLKGSTITAVAMDLPGNKTTASFTF